MTMSRTILITGVTGNQGGAVAQALQGSGFSLRGLTRKPESERAAALARHGVDVVKGDLDDEATLRRALAGAWGVFGVQNTPRDAKEKVGPLRRNIFKHGRLGDNRNEPLHRFQDGNYRFHERF